MVIEHLVERGVLPENIIGLDISEGLLKKASQRNPKTSFVRASASNFIFRPESFDLVTSNMAMHYLDNEQISRTLQLFMAC